MVGMLLGSKGDAKTVRGMACRHGVATLARVGRARSTASLLRTPNADPPFCRRPPVGPRCARPRATVARGGPPAFNPVRITPPTPPGDCFLSFLIPPRYEEATRIPLVFSNPKLWPKPKETPALVSHIDVSLPAGHARSRVHA